MVGDVVSIEKVSHQITIVSQVSARPKSGNIVGVTKYNIFECRNRFEIFKRCLPFFLESKLIIQQKLIDY